LEEELSRYFLDMSNRLHPLVKSPLTFDNADIPEIAQEEFIKNDKQHSHQIGDFFLF
jgi:hypothetical protein